jgi:transglutaminase-like putative cysteine protease
MKLTIHHSTRYCYASQLQLSTQVLRLTPRPTPGVQVLTWTLGLPGKGVPFSDAMGNPAHILTLDRPRQEIVLRADGEVLTPTTPVAPEPDGALPAPVFLRSTPLTEPDAAISAFAQPFKTVLATNPVEGLQQVSAALLTRMPYIKGSTDAATAAPEAFATGRGVCQDHAQVFIACLRLLGLPARYVSGYLATDAEHVASHAWAEVRLAKGWVGYDVSNDRWVDGSHVRLAYGADYLEACPVRGVRIGGGVEELETFVKVTSEQQ